MYYNNLRGRGNGRSSYPRYSNFSRGPRRVKFFNPSDLVRNQVTTEVEEIEYIAKNSFETLPLNDQLKRNILSKGYVNPTPIQDQTIPLIIEGKDVIGIANTGTGKTAAFLIPLIELVSKDRNKKVLIITPTRELAFQIKNEFLEFSRNMNIFCSLCIGGVSLYSQRYELRRNPNFVIGTPGRLKDLIRQRGLNIETFNVVVLDEVDQMVDYGFIEDIKYIVSLLTKVRQSLFFSATIDEKAKDVLSRFVHDPITVSVKKKDLLKNIRHDVVRVIDTSKKVDQLHDLLIKKEFEKVLIFGRTKHGIQRLSDELISRGFNADVIHGNKAQSQRLRTLDKFKRNNIQILLATDVASRGLDIDNVSHVINFDPPESYETYIHRAGRTGRGEKTGTAITFVMS